jgi:hypothetical protein
MRIPICPKFDPSHRQLLLPHTLTRVWSKFHKIFGCPATGSRQRIESKPEGDSFYGYRLKY